MKDKYLPAISLLVLIIPAGVTNAAAEKNIVSTVGIGYLNSMKYSGSDESSSTVVPYFNIQYDSFFIDAADGIGIDINLNRGFYLTQSLGYSLGRVDTDANWRAGSKKLKGMGTIKTAATSSTTVGWNLEDILIIEGNLTIPFTDSQGIKYSTGIKYQFWTDESDSLIFSSNANFGDRRYNNTFYGVSDVQNKNSGYRKYKAASGLYSLDAGLTWTHTFNDNWWSYVDMKYTHLDKNVNKSDIVYQNNQTRFSAGFLYSF